MTGRPPKPIATDALPQAARIGAEVRRRRLAQGLTLAELGLRAGYSPQHLSSLELASGTVTRQCLAAVDAALDADGALLERLPALVCERALANHARAGARRYDEDVEPTNRRGLLGGAAGAALTAAAVGPAPAAAREVDPALPGHWTELLTLLGSHDAMHGPHDVLSVVERELRVIGEHRAAARGELRTELMRVEARWAQFAAWLSNDAGNSRARHAWADRARRLAQQARYPDMLAFINVRESQWAAQKADARHAVAFAKAALRVPGISEQTQARGALRAAYGHALAKDADACGRSLADAETMMERADPLAVPPWVGRATIDSHVRPDEARCWLAMHPHKAIGLYEGVLHNWPRHRVRDRGLHQARLAVACAAAGELDRAHVEGRKALAITRTTKSSGAARELKRLGAALSVS